MSLQDTVSGERLHIGFFGLRNAGKSSLVNAVTGQDLSLVSPVKGTTTDPVKKAMELLPLGPVVIIDTPGLDDEGDLGAQRVQRAKQTLSQVHIAVLVVDATCGLQPQDRVLLQSIQTRKIPYLLALTKADLLQGELDIPEDLDPARVLYVSAKSHWHIDALRSRLGNFAKDLVKPRALVSDLVAPGDLVVLVMPIDASAPKGRLILPQQQVMRELLDCHASFVACQDTELADTLKQLRVPPKLVITDSQAFSRVSQDTPEDISLTSFSILFARYKGELSGLVDGARALENLRDSDRVLIAEGCTHHRQCNDIGSVKLPAWIAQYTGAHPAYTFSSGGSFPEDLSAFSLVIHCGACMLTPLEMQRRQALVQNAGVPMVNYGVAIAQMHGILRRSLSLFPDICAKLDR